MGIEKALEMSAQYGIVTVALFSVSSFLAILIVYVMKQNAKREERLSSLIEKDIHTCSSKLDSHDLRSAEAIVAIKSANDFQRKEHEKMIAVLENLEKAMQGLEIRLNASSKF